MEERKSLTKAGVSCLVLLFYVVGFSIWFLFNTCRNKTFSRDTLCGHLERFYAAPHLRVYPLFFFQSAYKLRIQLPPSCVTASYPRFLWGFQTSTCNLFCSISAFCLRPKSPNPGLDGLIVEVPDHTQLDTHARTHTHTEGLVWTSDQQQIQETTIPMCSGIFFFVSSLCTLAVLLCPDCPGFCLLSILYSTHSTTIHAPPGNSNPQSQQASCHRPTP